MRAYAPVVRLFSALYLMAVAAALPAERFIFKYVAGDKFRVLSTTDEYIYVNRRLYNQAQIVNRIAFEVKEVKDGAGRLVGVFQTSEREAGSKTAFLINTDYESDYWRSALGVYRIEDKYFMPVVRNVPVFPDRDLKIGDTWTHPGEEKHDFRRAYGIPEPYRIPFSAQYEYLGIRSKDGKEWPAFKVSYTIFYQPPPPRRYTSTYPTQIMGYSDQLVYWDSLVGQPYAFEDHFKIVIDHANGNTIEYVGTADGKVIEALMMDRDKVERDVRKGIERLDIGDTTVRKDERGVVISLEDIKFQANSAILLDSEKRKLDKLTEILNEYPDRDLLITGHTALAGTEAGRQKLSEDRARSVAEYLGRLGVRSDDRMLIRGRGATEPLGDNATEAGMRRNRRVEITILEN